ncbi:MAG: hypothetical protein K6G65_07145 [Lachnospiraceae bacterium]|nr:hypothetical protein [Lachnospiraceae bacterium]
MKVRKLSILLQTLFIFISMLIIANIILGTVLINQSKSSMKKLICDRMIDIANSAAATIDGDALEKLTAEDKGTEPYQKVEDALAVFRDNADLEFIYGIRQVGDKEFIFTVDPALEEASSFGDAVEYTDALGEAALGKTAVDDEPYEDDWGRFYSAYSPVFNSSGKVAGIIGVDISAAWYDAEVARTTRSIAIVCMIYILLGIIAVYLVARKLRRGFYTLYDKLDDLADGSGDLTKQITITSGDEFEAIAGKINLFIEEIRSLAQGVYDVSNDVLKISKELKDTSKNNSESVHKINSDLTSISSGMNDCSDTANASSLAIESATKDIESLSKEIGSVHNLVSKANSNAQKSSSNAISKQRIAVETLRNLEAKVRSSSDEAIKINQVREIAEQITNIASQTQILSLNAQIEAARAGEHGSGFAVVATEVGHLSIEITEAVSKINDINNQVINAVDLLMKSSQEMSAFMTETVVSDYDSYAQIGQEYGETTQSIDDTLKNLLERSNDLSEFVKQVDESINNINISVNDCANRSAALVSEVGSISESMEHLENNSDENDHQAKLLGDKISGYKF